MHSNQQPSNVSLNPYFTTAVKTLAHYAGFTLQNGKPLVADSINGLTPIYADRNHAEQVANALSLFAKMWGEDCLRKRIGLFSTVSILISYVKNALSLEQRSLQTTDSLFIILNEISCKSGLNYDDISSDIFEEFIYSRLLSNINIYSWPSCDELKEIIENNYAQVKKNHIADYIILHAHIFIECDLLQVQPINNPAQALSYYMQGQATSTIIVMTLLLNKITHTINTFDNNMKQHILKMHDYLEKIKTIPLATIMHIAKHNCTITQLEWAKDLLHYSNVLPDNMSADHALHSKKVFRPCDLDITSVIKYYDNNMDIAKFLFIPTILSADDASFVCSMIIKNGPKLHALITSEFNLDMNSVLRHHISHINPSTLQTLFQAYPPNTFDVTSKDAESGETVLHIAATKQLHYHAKLLISINRNCLFVKNNKGQFPSDCEHNWSIKSETYWAQVKLMFMLSTYYFKKELSYSQLPNDVAITIALLVAKLHCGGQEIALAIPNNALSSCDEWTLAYRK